MGGKRTRSSPRHMHYPVTYRRHMTAALFWHLNGGCLLCGSEVYCAVCVLLFAVCNAVIWWRDAVLSLFNVQIAIKYSHHTECLINRLFPSLPSLRSTVSINGHLPASRVACQVSDGGDVEGSCEYTEQAVADSRQGVVLQVWGWARG